MEKETLTVPEAATVLGIGVNKGFAAVHESFDDERAYKVVKSVIEIGTQEIHIQKNDFKEIELIYDIN